MALYGRREAAVGVDVVIAAAAGSAEQEEQKHPYEYRAALLLLAPNFDPPHGQGGRR